MKQTLIIALISTTLVLIGSSVPISYANSGEELDAKTFLKVVDLPAPKEIKKSISKSKPKKVTKKSIEVIEEPIEQLIEESSEEVLVYEEPVVEYIEIPQEEEYVEAPQESVEIPQENSSLYDSAYGENGPTQQMPGWYNNHKETYYSSNVLYHYKTDEWTPDDEGFYKTNEGYYVVASSEYKEGTIIDTGKGQAIVLDSGCEEGIVDFYTNW